MKITIVSANASARKDVKAGRGQSILIQSENHNLLFGFGPDKTFLKNLRALGVQLDIVDAAFLPCGISLCSGGLTAFLEENLRAVVYARINAFNARYKKSTFGKKDVTPDKSLRSMRRILRCKNYFLSKDNAFVTFSLPASEQLSLAASEYFTREEGNFVPDDFTHEMYLLVRAGKRWVLFCGDAYAGIACIVEHAQTLVRRNLGGSLVCVVGGFGLRTGKGKPASDDYIAETGETLAAFTDVIYYTGRSTGEHVFEKLKSMLGDRLHSFAAGDVIEV